ncbi:annexin family [Plasmopara halstedii]|uniref:Annexin family n=1 Tax=Plasmopara halstedii TaxID=4781 RepID=A0A0P1ART5_PLAHL|nr:annexin family [Plasmopara halstedii]CEG44089.1 annexin family [Plasmopara halstedii]|eukprot:XP_024580458.1 annexin family [Plasmopara halstedii]
MGVICFSIPVKTPQDPVKNPIKVFVFHDQFHLRISLLRSISTPTMLNLYPPSTHNAWNGQPPSYPAGTDSVVEEIFNATKGVGTKEKQLNKALGGKTATQRGFIAKRYKELHNQSLRDLLDDETSGHYEFLLKLLASPLPEAEAGILRKATKGLGTKEGLIYPVVVGRTNVEINILKKTYFDLYGEDLGSVLDSDLHGDFQKVEADVEKLYKTGRGKMGTDEEGFISVLVASPPEHLRIVAAAYEKKYSEPLVKAAAHEFTGNAEKAVLFLIRMVTEPLDLLAELFEESLKGFGTDENALSSAVVRYHIVLRDIKPVYKKKYGKELRERIAEEVSGDYGELLLSVFDARD